MKVYKYGPLTLGPAEHRFTRPLKVMMQAGEFYLWALSDEHTDHAWDIAAIGTGYDFPEGFLGRHYVDSIMNGSFVWHIFAKEKV